MIFARVLVGVGWAVVIVSITLAVVTLGMAAVGTARSRGDH